MIYRSWQYLAALSLVTLFGACLSAGWPRSEDQDAFPTAKLSNGLTFPLIAAFAGNM